MTDCKVVRVGISPAMIAATRPCASNTNVMGIDRGDGGPGRTEAGLPARVEDRRVANTGVVHQALVSRRARSRGADLDLSAATVIADHCEPCCGAISATIRTARSRSSCGSCSVVPCSRSSQRREPPNTPGGVVRSVSDRQGQLDQSDSVSESCFDRGPITWLDRSQLGTTGVRRDEAA